MPVFKDCSGFSSSRCRASAETNALAPRLICATRVTGESPPPEKVGQVCTKDNDGLGALDSHTCGRGECIQFTGKWEYPVMVSISVEPAAAQIYFTTDGTVPSTASNMYTQPFELPLGKVNTTLRAVGVLKEYVNSDVAAAVYEVPLDILTAKPQSLPLWAVIAIASCTGEREREAGGGGWGGERETERERACV